MVPDRVNSPDRSCTVLVRSQAQVIPSELAGCRHSLCVTECRGAQRRCDNPARIGSVKYYRSVSIVTLVRLLFDAGVLQVQRCLLTVAYERQCLSAESQGLRVPVR